MAQAGVYLGGRLQAPLGWAAPLLLELAEHESKLIRHLLEADVRRLHVLAFALVHGPQGCSQREWASTLATAPSKKIIGWCLGTVPFGLIGTLGRLGSDVISKVDYQRLLTIVRDPVRARLVRHTKSIWPSDLAILESLPAVLCRRPVLDAFQGDVEWIGGFSIAVAHLMHRTDIEQRLVQITDVGALRSAIIDIVNTLPLPPFFPPAEVGSWKRIDRPDDLKRLGRDLANCIGDFGERVRDGLAAVYALRVGEDPMVCVAVRRGRLGWFIDEMKLAGNREVTPARQGEIEDQFSEAGVPPSVAADALEALLSWDNPYRSARHRRRCWSRRRNSPVTPPEDAPPF